MKLTSILSSFPKPFLNQKKQIKTDTHVPTCSQTLESALMQSSGTTSSLLKKVQPLTWCLGRTATRQTCLHTHINHDPWPLLTCLQQRATRSTNKAVNFQCTAAPRGIPVINGGFSKDCQESISGLSSSVLFVSCGIEWCVTALELDCWFTDYVVTLILGMPAEYPAVEA